MRIEPTCRLCRQRTPPVITAAQIADHIEPVSKGATLQEKSDRMWFGELQSVCLACHSSTKAHIERHGFSREIGRDGYPVDKRHPAYASNE
jgi:5-methylcytosine-specific restriction enzyme A